MSVEYYRKEIIDLRERVKREREAKKSDNESYARSIKNAPSSYKAMYRKQKVDRAASHDRTIKSLQESIARAQLSLAREKKR